MNIHMSALAGGFVIGVLLMAHFAVYRRQQFAPRRAHGGRDLRPLLFVDAIALAFAILMAVMLRWALAVVAPGNPRWAVDGVRYMADVGMVGVAVVLACVDSLSVWRSSRDE
jgi:hypothetical protein